MHDHVKVQHQTLTHADDRTLTNNDGDGTLYGAYVD